MLFLLTQTVDEMHQIIDHLIHAPDYKSDYDGSNHYYNRAFDQLTFGRPRSLIPQLGIRLLDIRK
jgi:hypothetical protein